MQAADFAAKCHAGQKRKFGNSPYINHPISVAKRISHNHQNQSLIVAALLHDVIEDCDVSYVDIQHYFGDHIAVLVQSVTNSCFEGDRLERKTAEFNRISKCGRHARILKLYDRLDNIEDLESHMISGNATKGFCELYAKESLMLIDLIGNSDEQCSQQIDKICVEILRKSILIN